MMKKNNFKKIFLAVTMIVVMFAVFAFSASAEFSLESGVPNQVYNSAVLQILIDNGVVDLDAVDQCFTDSGILVNDNFSSSAVYTSNVTFSDLIKDFSSNSYYVFSTDTSFTNYCNLTLDGSFLDLNETYTGDEIVGLQYTGVDENGFVAPIIIVDYTLYTDVVPRDCYFEYPVLYSPYADSYYTPIGGGSSDDGGFGEVVSEIITILVSGLTGIATGIGGGLKMLVESVFLTSTVVDGVTTFSLSTFGGVIIVFAAIGLAVGLSKFVVHWVTSLGN